MNPENWSRHPHRRLNVLTGDWVLVSPQRTRRPWQGRVEARADEAAPQFDPACYLCPGNRRANGESNPGYRDTFAFDNDFPALEPETPDAHHDDHGLLVAASESGACRVVCFSPRHDLTLAEMDTAAIGKVVTLWTEEFLRLGAREDINHVQIFENKGEVMGCSNPHPHGQIWAQRSIPCEPAKELGNMSKYFAETGTPLLISYVERELDLGERLVCANDSFVAVVPFWAVWPFETMILPRTQLSCMPEMNEEQAVHLADIIRRVTVRYDNVFGCSFPYSSGFHQAPTDGRDYSHCTLHMHFYPPLLRSAEVRKFMVGYEMLASPQRDITPESAAELLREQSEVHYRSGDD